MRQILPSAKPNEAQNLPGRAAKQSVVEPRIVDICSIFDRHFVKKFHTQVVYGYDEPLYKPLSENGEYAQIQCNQDYVSSALHEIAHWCVAGQDRRNLIDYGYWYEPDGRTENQQSLFEKVEVKPQALEWIFSTAIGIEFCVSADNLDSGLAASMNFKEAILTQVFHYCSECTNTRAHAFALALADFYDQPSPFEKSKYSMSLLA